MGRLDEFICHFPSKSLWSTAGDISFSLTKAFSGAAGKTPCPNFFSSSSWFQAASLAHVKTRQSHTTPTALLCNSLPLVRTFALLHEGLARRMPFYVSGAAVRRTSQVLSAESTTFWSVEYAISRIFFFVQNTKLKPRTEQALLQVIGSSCLIALSPRTQHIPLRMSAFLL